VVTTELAGAATEFGYYFRSMVAALGDRTGWYGVFAERDPGAAHAYESGSDVPPWDVVSAVLHDLAAAVGAPLDDIEVTRARTLHRAAVAAWDAAPGAESALRARLDATTRARDMALLREREAGRALERATSDPSSPAAARLTNILAWARDDRERAAARCDEIRVRLASFAAAPAPDWFRQVPERPREAPAPAPAPAAADWPDAFTAGPDPGPDPGPGSRPAAHDGRTAGAGLGAAADPEFGARPQGRAARGASWARGSREDAEGGQAPTGKRGKGGTRPRGARFAGTFEEAPAPVAPPAEPSAPPAAGPTPRGARFAGAPATPSQRSGPAAPAPVRAAGPTPRGARFAGAPEREEPQAPAPADDPRWLAQARQEAARLGELRRTGQSGAAYVVICEAAEGPAPRLPYLVRELERTELSADVATLLWEVAALPAAPLAAAASELAAAGRAGDCRTLLHQAASRPPADLATIAGVLTSAGRHEEAGELLQTLARARPPEEAAAVVKARPGLAAPLLAAAESVSRSRRRDVAAALRRASLPEA
jgi:hypothetical protein